MAEQVVKTYKGEKATQRGIAEMSRKGYEVDQMSSTNVKWSPMMGTFTRKQKHTIVFKKPDEPKQPTPPPGSGAWSDYKLTRWLHGLPRRQAASRYLREATGLTAQEIEQVGNARDVKIHELAELYHDGKVPELGPRDEKAGDPDAGAGGPETIQTVASVADELTKLAALRDSGVLTGDEFEAQKAKLLQA